MYSRHIILDFEMNPVGMGFPEVFQSLRQEIIEIGAVMLNNRLEVVSRFRCLVKPDYNPHITPYITKLTGIRFSDVAEAPSLGEALALLSDWIGCGRGCRVYSWSGSDLKQLRNECACKGIPFPANMKRWLDFQRPFPRMMHMARTRRQLALKDAAQYFDIAVDRRKAHSALYDAEITAQLLMYFLNGTYKAQTQFQVREETTRMTGAIGDLCGGALAELLKQMQAEAI